MTELLTAAQMRAIEQAAIESGAVTGLELMERAGQGVVEAVLEEWPELALTSHRAVVLCGPGNNGGDGFVVARLLKARGWDVEVFLYGDAEGMPPDARVNYERWLGAGHSVSGATQLAVDASFYQNTDVFIDACFGTGLTRPFPAELGSWVAATIDGQSSRSRLKTVAVDIASGICADSGRALNSSRTILPKLVVTFHAAKQGHYLNKGAENTRSRGVKVIDIGLQGNAFSATKLTSASIIAAHKAPSLHKYAHGHALILSGPAGQTGAARLAARGALRVGAGVVSIAAPPEAIAENAAQLNAIMLKPVVDVGALAGILEDARIKALCIGPGFGTSAREVGILAEVLGVPVEARPEVRPEMRNECAPYGDEVGGRDSAVPGLTRDLDAHGKDRGPGAGAGAARGRCVVLDADALTLLAKHPALFAALHENCILTPHAGEFARLFPDIAEKLAAPATKGPAYSKVDATREAATRAGCVVLFKGADTVIADPQGRCAINSAHYERAAPWLATAGSGDVLAGFITGLLARGLAPMAAAESAAWLHVECARHFGAGLIAEDIPEQLPAVFRALGVN